MIGIFTFSLMVRWSMLVGWYELLRNPRSIRFNKRYSGQAFVAARKQLSDRSGKGAEEKKPQFRNFPSPETLEQKPTCVLPDPEENESPRLGSGGMAMPEAGDVSKRHDTTNLFEESDEEIDEKVMKGKARGKRVRADDESDLV